MGASESKPTTTHTWKASPIGLSSDVAESLQSNSETDRSRAQTLELAVQARLAEELKKMSAHESETLREAREKASAAIGEAKNDDQSNSHQAVSKEVETLRARLDKRKQLRPAPDSVERARGEVVRCLVEHDRRPLDCWQEVENFKEEVRRMEKSWVEKVVR